MQLRAVFRDVFLFLIKLFVEPDNRETQFYTWSAMPVNVEKKTTTKISTICHFMFPETVVVIIYTLIYVDARVSHVNRGIKPERMW